MTLFKTTFFGDCQSRHQSEMAMNARHLTGAGTMFLKESDRIMIVFVTVKKGSLRKQENIGAASSSLVDNQDNEKEDAQLPCKALQ